MQFQVEHFFPTLDGPKFEAVYLAESFNQDLCAHLGLVRQLLELTISNGQFRRVLSISPQRELPAPIANLLGGQKLAYREILDYSIGSMRGTWRIEPALMPDKIKSGGHFAFERHLQGTKRIFTGEVQVGIFAVGKMVEKLICSDIERSYNEAAVFTTSWLQNHPMPELLSAHTTSTIRTSA